MSKFVLSAFGDEIDMSLDVQMEELNSYNIKHIELRGVDGKNVSELSLDEARNIKRRLDDKGFKISALGSPIGKINITDAFEDHLNMFDNLLEIALILDTKYIRIFSFFIPKNEDPDKYFSEVLARLKKFTIRAEKKGIILLHENEKDIYGDIPERCLKIITSINSPNFKAIFDPANFIQCNVETYPYAFNMLKDYIQYMHIKDAFLESGHVVPVGSGDGKIFEILTQLKNSKFEGFLTLEPHLGAFEGLEKLEKNIDIKNIKKGGKYSFSVAFKALNKLLNNLN